MKLKFINLLLASVLLIGSAQVFTSCKDNEADVLAELKAEDVTLRGLIDKNTSDLQAVKLALESKITDLQGQITSLKNDLNNYATKAELQAVADKLTATQTQVNQLENALEVVNGALAAAQGDINDLKGDVSKLSTTVGTILASLDETEGDVSDLKARVLILEVAKATIEQEVADLIDFKNTIESLLPEFTQQIIALQAANAENAAKIAALEATDVALNDAIAAVTAQAGANAEAIEALEGVQADQQQQIEEILAALGDYATLEDLANAQAKLSAEINEAYEDAIKYTEELYDELDKKIDSSIAEVKQEINERLIVVEARVTTLELAVAQLNSKIQAVKDQLDTLSAFVDSVSKRISGIVIQQVENNVFGTFNLPVGIQSSILASFFGEVANPVDFPALGEDYALTDKEIKQVAYAKAQAPITIPAGRLLKTNKDGQASLGTVYMTINPTNIDPTNGDYRFYVVNSLDQKLPIDIQNIEKSSKELTFGYSRSGNGFYEADALVDADNVETFHFVLNDQFKDEVKGILKDLRGKHFREIANAKTIVTLGNALYNQFNGILPALGIKACWDEQNAEGKKELNQAISSYSIAAAVIKPLSFDFLKGQSLFQIPNLPDLGNLVDRLDFNIDASKYQLNLYDPENPFKVTFNEVEYKFEPQIDIEWNDGETQLYYIMTVFNGTSATYYKVPIDGSLEMTEAIQNAFTTLVNQIATALGDVVGSVESQSGLNYEFTQLVKDINKQVNDMLKDMDTEVNSTIEKVVADLQQQVNGKLQTVSDKISRFTDKLQAVINRVNHLLADPNHYLQPILLYSVNGNFGRMSAVKGMPSQFVLADPTADAVTLVPTTYTGGTIAPVFKKYVAITNVWETANPANSVYGGNRAQCISLMNNANNQQYMAEVVDGSLRTFPFYFRNGKGYTYEITYQAVDFFGVVTGQKYYVTIK